MAQKLVNLHCKALWALGLVPESYSQFFHPIIDSTTLELLKRNIAWTKLDSYEAYMELQLAFRAVAQEHPYPLALECQYWNDHSKRASSSGT